MAQVLTGPEYEADYRARVAAQAAAELAEWRRTAAEAIARHMAKKAAAQKEAA